MKRKVTNIYGIPEPIVEAIINDPYDSGPGTDYSITTLIKPPRMLALEKQHEPTVDASDLLYTLQGQIMHLILERAGNALAAEGYVVEKRFYKTYAVNGRIFKVSAQVDLFDPVSATVTDYKYSSVYSAKDIKPEHLFQVSAQAELLREKGFQVEHGKIVILLRDWKKSQAAIGKHPDHSIVTQNLTLLSSSTINDWIVERIKLHEAAKTVLPECSQDERWQADPSYAVMKEGGKRAQRVCSTKQEAEFLVKNGANLHIVERPSVPTRCADWCPVREFCEQGQRLLKQGEDNNGKDE